MTSTVLEELDASEESRKQSKIGRVYSSPSSRSPESDVNILFEDKQDYHGYPGIPYVRRAESVRIVLTEKFPSASALEKLLDSREPNHDVLVTPLSLAKGAEFYLPTTYHRLKKNMPAEFLKEHFSSSKKYSYDEDNRVLLQLRTEIETKAATIDSAIIHNRKNIETMVSKAHLANRIYSIGRIYGYLKERKFPLELGNLSDPQSWDDSLLKIKSLFTEFLMEIPFGNRKYERVVKKIGVSKEQIEKKFVYLEHLKGLLGDNLVAALVYGSAVQSNDPKKYADYDNILRVKDVPSALGKLRGSAPNVIDGKFINWDPKWGKVPEHAKHVSLRIIPESEEYLQRLVRALHDPREFLEDTLVIYGEFPCWKVSSDEAKESGISQSYMKLKSGWDALNWAYTRPERLVGHKSLFEFVVKNKRFFLQHFLNAKDGQRRRGKEELDSLLADRAMIIPTYSPDLNHIRNSVRDAAIDVFRLQEELMSSGLKPDFSFLTDNK